MNVFKKPDLRFAARLADSRLLVSCQKTNSILVTDAEGKVQDSVVADFNKPQDIAVDAVTGEVYVTDRYNHCVKVFNCNFQTQRTFGAGQLNQPVGIAVKDGRVYVADNENHRIAVFSTNGTLVDTIGQGFGHKENQLYCPCGVALYKDLVIVAEWGNGRLQIFRDGKSVLVVGGIGHAHHVIVDPNGRIYVAQYSDKKIRIFKIHTNTDNSLGFTVNEDGVDLDDNPCGLFWDNGKLGVVTKTRLMHVFIPFV